VPPIVQDILRSPGQPLDPATRTFMELRFGHDFSRVRVHTDTLASTSARAVNALAYTVGQEVVFGSGQYAPGTNVGRRLIAHELTHTLQQRPTMHAPMAIGCSQDETEQQAKQVETEIIPLSTDPMPRTSTHYPSTSKINQGIESANELRRQSLEPEGGTTGTRSDEQASEAVGDSESATETFTGLCFRTPIGPGQVRLNGCSASQLSDYAIMPESGATTITPSNGVWYDSDGFWFSHHAPKTEWFKVSNHCDLDLVCEGSTFSYSYCCNAAASLIKGTPRWTSDSHVTHNPF
jgi:hypothetical protein